ncbi:MAG: hypothetical protein Q4D14_03675 [Bacteroidales bacterium]|nr:hypothetical protein [Bacteroidales bacterium]
MKNSYIYKWLTRCLLLALLLTAQTTEAKIGRYNSRGIYNGFNDNHVVTIGIGANYYFGDLETTKAFSTTQIGGQLTLGYRYQFNQYAAVGLQFNGGMMRGDDTYRYHFKSYYEETDLLYTCFPIPNAGLFLATGVGFGIEVIQFEGNSSTGTSYNNKNTCYTPLIPLQLGYLFKIGDNSRLGLQFCYHFALQDNPGRTLDGYPFYDNQTIVGEKDSQNSDSYASLSIHYEILF